MCTADEWASFTQHARTLACWQFPNIPPQGQSFALGTFWHNGNHTIWWPAQKDAGAGPDFGSRFAAVQVSYPVQFDHVPLSVRLAVESRPVALAAEWAAEQYALRQRRRMLVLQDREERRAMRLLTRYAAAVELSGRPAVPDFIWKNTGQDEESRVGMLCVAHLCGMLRSITRRQYQRLPDGPPFPISGNLVLGFSGSRWPDVTFRSNSGQQIFLPVYADDLLSALMDLRRHRPLWKPSGLLRAIHATSCIMAWLEDYAIGVWRGNSAGGR